MKIRASRASDRTIAALRGYGASGLAPAAGIGQCFCGFIDRAALLAALVMGTPQPLLNERHLSASFYRP